MPRILDVTAANGVPFRVVYLAGGETSIYQSSDTDAPLVEFYDRRHPFTEHGQFTGGRYYADTLLGIGLGAGARVGSDGRGLNLQGGEPDWTLDADTATQVVAWIEAQA